MTHVDLVWPGVVLVLSIAGAVIVRTVAAQADRASRARTRKWVHEVWQESRGREPESHEVARTSPDESTPESGGREGKA